MSVLTRALLCASLAFPGFAQISIKPATGVGPPSLKVLPNGDVIAIAVPVITLISYAYDVPVNPSPRLSALPAWTVRERYDIQAKAAADAGRLDAKQMVRALLADRFKLVMRVENKTMTVYALTVADGGPKLQRAVSDEDSHNFAGGLGHPLNAKAVDMDDLAHYIANWTDRPVVNRTALAGLFTVSTPGWVPMRLPPPPSGGAPAANPFAGLTSIFTVLRTLGLELKPQEDTLPVYTVERIERPA